MVSYLCLIINGFIITKRLEEGQPLIAFRGDDAGNDPPNKNTRLATGVLV